MSAITYSSTWETRLFAVLVGIGIGLIAGCDESSRGEYREFAAAQKEERQDAPRDNAPSSPPGSHPPNPDRSSVANSRRETVAGSAETPNPETTGGPSEEIEAKRAAPAPAPSDAAAAGDSSAQRPETPVPQRAVRGSRRGPLADVNSPSTSDPQRPNGREAKLLIKERDFQVVGPEGALRVTYDDIDLLRVLNMQPVTPKAPDLMPQWLKNLDGRRIRIRGFMYPAFQETGLKRFLLARDNQICCFGRNPKIYDLFGVELREGETTDYIQNRPFDVVGVFHIDPQVEDGELYQLYRIDEAIVIDK